MHALRPESASLWALETNSGPLHGAQGLVGKGLVVGKGPLVGKGPVGEGSAGPGVEQGLALTARHTLPPSHLVDSEMVVAW